MSTPEPDPQAEDRDSQDRWDRWAGGWDLED
jgi:hypothetical protein